MLYGRIWVGQLARAHQAAQFRLPDRGVDFMDFPTLAIEANLDAFLRYVSNVFTATRRTKLYLADLSIWLIVNCVLEQEQTTARCVRTLSS